MLRAGGNVGRMIDRNRVGMQIIFASGAHHDFACIDADPDLQRRRTTAASKVVAVPMHVVSYSQRGVQSSLRMVLAGNRWAEQRKRSGPLFLPASGHLPSCFRPREPLINSWNAALRSKSSVSALRRLPIVPAITCDPRLESNHFESQSDCPRMNQRLPSSFRLRPGSRDKNLRASCAFRPLQYPLDPSCYRR